MADGYDRFDNEGGGGGSFVMGLLTGTVLGAGLGMLFAPKSGSELRNQLSEHAGSLANAASEGYRRAQESASDWSDKGRDMYEKARDVVSRGADEAQRRVHDVASSVTGQSSSSPGAPATPGPSSMSTGPGNARRG
jgi:gas vesicle protein